MEANALRVSTISAHKTLVYADAAMRKETTEFVKGCIDLAPDVNAELLPTLAGPYPEGVPKEQAWQWVVEIPDECCDYAEKRGVVSAFEPVGFAVVADMQGTQLTLGDMTADNFMTNFDSSHLLDAEEDPAEWIRALGQRVVHTHMKEARRLRSGRRSCRSVQRHDRFRVPSARPGFHRLVGSSRRASRGRLRRLPIGRILGPPVPLPGRTAGPVRGGGRVPSLHRRPAQAGELRLIRANQLCVKHPGFLSCLLPLAGYRCSKSPWLASRNHPVASAT